MLPYNDYLLTQVDISYEVRELTADAEQRRLLRVAGPVWRSWFTWQLCRTLRGLGHLMVAAGRRLEQRYAGPSLIRA